MSAQISAIYTYPLKSAKGISHQECILEATGLLRDRRWMLGLDNGDVILEKLSQRECPKMALIEVHALGNVLIASAPDMPTLKVENVSTGRRNVQVWNDVCEGDDLGDEAAAWFSEFLELPLRLLRMPDTFYRRVDITYAPEAAQASYADGYPLLIISEASLESLNQQMTERGIDAVTMNRFRPNLVISGVDPFAEDTWKRFRIGEIEFDVVKPCARCVLTTVDPELGKIVNKAEPLATLATFRRTPNGKVMFGQNVVHRGIGTLHVGDELEILTT